MMNDDDDDNVNNYYDYRHFLLSTGPSGISIYNAVRDFCFSINFF